LAGHNYPKPSAIHLSLRDCERRCLLSTYAEPA
jgi:hypothetical protein